MNKFCVYLALENKPTSLFWTDYVLMLLTVVYLALEDKPSSLFWTDYLLMLLTVVCTSYSFRSLESHWESWWVLHSHILFTLFLLAGYNNTEHLFVNYNIHPCQDRKRQRNKNIFYVQAHCFWCSCRPYHGLTFLNQSINNVIARDMGASSIELEAHV